VQKVEGYQATLCAGVPIFEKGEHTGALPGKLVRAGRDSAAARVAAE
jgi:N-acyl-D-aspartate/D-glutamate deacylase